MKENIQKYRFLPQILPDSSQHRLVLITGARQTGKTTLAKRKFPDLRYINLDAPENREQMQMLHSAQWADSVGHAIIDEAQKEPVVFEKIKYAYDEGGISFQVLLGSSQILLLKKIRESLAGRVSIYELWPLMMSELLWNINSIDVPVPLIERLLSNKDFNSILSKVPSVLMDRDLALARQAEDHLYQWGGMPALLPLSEEEKWKWLRDYEYTYLERDLGDLARLDDLNPFRKFQRLSALRSAHLLNYSDLARDSNLSVDTARRYLEYLNLSYQVILLQPFYRNITSTIVKTPKIYWLDIGLMRQLCGFFTTDVGQIFETLVVGEIVKWIRTMQKKVEVFFYRTRSGLEVDIILQTAHGFIGIEIKSREKIVPSDFRAMKEISSVLGQQWHGGMVVYRGNKIKFLSDPGIWAIPSFRLFT